MEEHIQLLKSNKDQLVMELVAPQDNQPHPPNLYLPIGGDEDYQASYCSYCISKASNSAALTKESKCQEPYIVHYFHKGSL